MHQAKSIRSRRCRTGAVLYQFCTVCCHAQHCACMCGRPCLLRNLRHQKRFGRVCCTVVLSKMNCCSRCGLHMLPHADVQLCMHIISHVYVLVKPAQWSQIASEPFPVSSKMAPDLGKDAACCSKGDSWDGEPSGRIVKIGDLDTYLSTPPQPSTRAVLLVSGIAGLPTRRAI